MDKIDLDAIIEKHGVWKENGTLVTDKEWAINAMKEAIHQALVLASEKAEIRTEEVYNERHHEDEYIPYIDKQSILNVINLIKYRGKS